MMTNSDEKLSVSTLLVLALTAVVPLSVATGFSNFERPRQVVLAVVAGLALICWGVGLVRRGSASMASPGTMALGAGFVGCVTVSLAWSGILEFGALSAVMWVSLGAVFLVLSAPVGRRPRFLDWATAVAAGALGAGGLGIYDLFGFSGLTPVWEPAGATGGFDAMAFGAAYYLVALPILVAAVAISRGLRRWFVAVALVVASLHTVVLIDGLLLGLLVGAMGLSALVMGAFGGASVERPSKIAIGSSALIAAVALGALVFYDRPDAPNLADDLPRVMQSSEFDAEMARQDSARWWFFAPDRMESQTGQEYRSYLNSTTLGLWQDEPIIGHGAGGWWLMQSDVVDVSDDDIASMFDRYPAFKSPHSDYSRIAVEQGALGLLLFVLWLLGVATAIIGSLRSNELIDAEDGLVMWALASTFVVGVAAMGFVPLLELVSSAVVWVGAAAMAVSVSAHRSSSNDWLAVVSFGKQQGWVRYGTVLLVTLVAVAMAIPAVLHAKASLERGYGDHLMLHSQFDEAISWYEKSHETYPAHPGILYNQAVAYRIQGDAVAGADEIQEALEMRPYDARFHVLAAHVELAENRVRPALDNAEEAVRTAPMYLEAYEVYAAALQRRASYRDTAAVFESVLELDPPPDKERVFRVQYASLLSDFFDDPEGAIEHLEIAIEKFPVGSERSLLGDRIEELENRIERERLEEAGEPVPPELQPEIDMDGHDHDHGGPLDLHDHGHDDDHGDGPPESPLPSDPQEL